MAERPDARPPLVDSHAHLQSPEFADDGARVLTAAREAGLVRILVPAWNLRSSRSGLAFARAHGVPTSAGIHPHDATANDDPTWAEIRELARLPEVAAIPDLRAQSARLADRLASEPRGEGTPAEVALSG